MDKNRIQKFLSSTRVLQFVFFVAAVTLVGIYDGPTVVGFAMYGCFAQPEPEGQLWLDRLLIDRAYQGRGYGAGAVAALLERLPKEYGKDRVFLSVYDDNQGAIRLYEKLGFAFNGELDTKGERVMVYTVPRPNAPTEREERERAHDRSV